ncbi:MAG: hypothetical protein FIA97_18695 [Methylococcaceae bacterium]|nr:hypothetical protein [Methylococcaceae bacterium]
MPQLNTKSRLLDSSVNAAVVGVLLLACAGMAQAKPDEVTDQQVRGCSYLDRVEGSSGYGKNQDWKGIAKYSALSKARNLGASHIVWERVAPVGVFNGTATARAYSCKS